MKLAEKHFVALQAIVEASEKIMEIYQEDFAAIAKDDGSPVTKADLASSFIIREHLEKTNIPITGEEGEKADFEERKTWVESWCVDPLDGTKEFIKKNGEFAVNISLIHDHKAVFGAIGSPVNKTIIFGGQAFGAFSCTYDEIYDKSKWKSLVQIEEVNEQLMVATSRTHHSGNTLNVIRKAEDKYGKAAFLKKGSSLKFFDLVEGRADLYPRFAPTMEWDISAGQAIYEAIGGEVLHAETLEPLMYNRPNLTNPYFIAKKKVLDL